MKLDLKQTTILMGMCSALGIYAPEVQASNGGGKLPYHSFCTTDQKGNW